MFKFNEKYKAKSVKKGVTKKNQTPYTLITLQSKNVSYNIWCFSDVKIENEQEFMLTKAESVGLSVNNYNNKTYTSISIVVDESDIIVPEAYMSTEISDFSADMDTPF